jgi:hypothetical protein
MDVSGSKLCPVVCGVNGAEHPPHRVRISDCVTAQNILLLSHVYFLSHLCYTDFLALYKRSFRADATCCFYSL